MFDTLIVEVNKKYVVEVPDTGGGTVEPPVTPLTISGTPPTSVTENQGYSFIPTITYPDGTVPVFSITNNPAWMQVDPVTGEVFGTPTAEHVGIAPNIVLSVSAGGVSVNLNAFAVTVIAANHLPVISGTPPTAATVTYAYTFTPVATDADAGDVLTFSVDPNTFPSFLTLDPQTGQISGTPGINDIGVHANIVLSVSDGKDTVSLPAFSITVVDTPPVNQPPVIAGTPPISVFEGYAYNFQPAASDPNGDPLTFGITNKPSWATFSAATGQLSGTPGAGDVGTTNGIIITVSDGIAAPVALPAFDLEVVSVATKYTAGHFIATKGRALPSGTQYSEAATFIEKKNCKALISRWDWKELEPTKGNYTLTTATAGLNSIENWLAQLANSNNPTGKLVVLIVVKGFNGDNRLNPMPPYMDPYVIDTVDTSTALGGAYKTGKRWVFGTTDDWTDRLAKLAEAIYAQFDNDPNFLGVAFQETALGITNANLWNNGYTASLYRQALVALLTRCRAAAVHSEVFHYFNFFSPTPTSATTTVFDGKTNVDQLLTACEPLGIILGGPDILPENNSLVNNVYPLYGTHKNALRMFCANQNDSYSARKASPPYAGVTGYYTMEELFYYGINNLACEIIVWNNEVLVSGTIYNANDGFAVMAAIASWTPGLGNTAPKITAIPNMTFNELDYMYYPVVATDAEFDTLSYSATGLPLNVVLGAADGKFRGFIALGQAGTYNVNVLVDDGNAVASAGFVLTVNAVSQIMNTVFDNATGAAIPLAGFPADQSLNAQTWSQQSGACEVPAGGTFVTPVDPAVFQRFSYLNAAFPGQVQVRFRNGFTGTDNNSQVAIMFRGQDAQNEWRLLIHTNLNTGAPAGGDLLELGYIQAGGVFTVVASVQLTTGNNPILAMSDWTITDDGNNIVVYNGGIAMISAVSTLFADVGKRVGFRSLANAKIEVESITCLS